MVWVKIQFTDGPLQCTDYYRKMTIKFSFCPQTRSGEEIVFGLDLRALASALLSV